MDVVILALNSKYIHSSLAPWYLKSAVDDSGISSVVIEHTVNEPIEVIIDSVLKHNPKVLAISVYIWNVKYTYEVAKRIKARFLNIDIILGGPEVSYNSADVLKSGYIDYVICGEGEVPFTNLCRYLLFKETVDLAGVSFNGTIAKPYIGTQTPKSPYTEEYFNSLNNRIAYFESGRGCPYSCAYCLSGRCEGIRFFDIDYVKENLLKLANSGTKTIKFVDRTFNADRRRAYDLFSFLINSSGISFPGDVCFHFELSADLIDDDTIKLLSSAPRGLFQFEIGIQSFNFETLNSIHRKTSNDVLKLRIRQLVDIGNAHIHTDLIAGLPYENYDSFVESFDQAYALGANMLQLGFLKILHGTELEEKAYEYGLKFSNEPPYEVYETPWLRKEELFKLKLAENALDRLYNSGRFKRTISLCLPWFDSAYSFYFECGSAINASTSLDEMTNALFAFLCAKFPYAEEEIRDALVCDRLATNSSKGLPKSLYRADSFISEVKKTLNKEPNTAETPYVRRNIAILYHAKKAVYADYVSKNEQGEYTLKFIDLYEKT